VLASVQNKKTGLDLNLSKEPIQMAFYREKDGNIFREYLMEGSVETYVTEKATLEIVPSKEFGNILFLDGELELARKDEYIYHEMLVHPVMSIDSQQEICIVGGGDGCCAREILKWNSVKSIDLFDWDERLIDLFTTTYSAWNLQSLSNAKVKIHPQNVLDIVFEKQYDVVFVDLVDPNYEDMTSRELWQTFIPMLPSLLKPMSSLVINGGGIRPWNTKNVEWLLLLLSNAFESNETHTIEVYKTFVPSFQADWCFFLIKPIGSKVHDSLFNNDSHFRYMDTSAWSLATTWPKDYEGSLPLKPVKVRGYLPPL
jgi:predicted membrane-bound spermidine synthase